MSCFLYKTRWNRSTLGFLVKIFLSLSIGFTLVGELEAKTNLKNHKGNWKPMDLVWEESSGAVAPEYRYAKTYHLFADSKKIFLTRKIIKKGKLLVEETKEISASKYETWMKGLLSKGIQKFPFETLPEEQMTGISYNFVQFRFGSTKSKFYYRLEEINEPNWKPKKDIIKFIERMKP
ncbi:hypothetical protein [Leptospira kemamanensis]|nr:hypothetical protein [Leptospira kemamanensis]